MYDRNKCSLVKLWNTRREGMKQKNMSFDEQNCIRWVISEYRKDQRAGVLAPIIRSRYVEELFSKGAGFHEQGTVRESNKRL